MRAHSAIVRQHQLELILELRLQLVGFGVDPVDRTEQVQRLVDEMTSEVTQQPAAGCRRLRVRSPSLKGRLEATDLTQLAGMEQPAHGKQV